MFTHGGYSILFIFIHIEWKRSHVTVFTGTLEVRENMNPLFGIDGLQIWCTHSKRSSVGKEKYSFSRFDFMLPKLRGKRSRHLSTGRVTEPITNAVPLYAVTDLSTVLNLSLLCIYRVDPKDSQKRDSTKLTSLEDRLNLMLVLALLGLCPTPFTSSPTNFRFIRYNKHTNLSLSPTISRCCIYYNR
jgi:hypothetical protein